MKIRYSGNRNEVTSSRRAVISFDPYEDVRVALVITFLKDIGWKGFDWDWDNNCVSIDMKDKVQYDEFLTNYIDAKKLF